RHWFCDPSYIHDRLTGAVHVFYSHAKDRGVWDAVAGTDDTDRDVLGSVVGTSDDQGRSWTHRSVTAIAAPPELVRTAFPTSGAGIQLRRGEPADRLLPPYFVLFLYYGRLGEQQVQRYYVLVYDYLGLPWQ